MNLKRLFVMSALAIFALCWSTPDICTPAFAQPDLDDQPKAQNPVPQAPFADWQELQKLAPTERRAAVRRIIEQTLRDAMTWTGFPDKVLQDAVVAAGLERETALDNVREKHRDLVQGLMDREANDEEIFDLMAGLQSAREKAQTTQTAAIAALDTKIQFSQNPRLAAFLSLVGVTGDESALLGGILGNVMGAMANLAAAQPPTQ